jgi:hypothetical protein
MEFEVALSSLQQLSRDLIRSEMNRVHTFTPHLRSTLIPLFHQHLSDSYIGCPIKILSVIFKSSMRAICFSNFSPLIWSPLYYLVKRTNYELTHTATNFSGTLALTLLLVQIFSSAKHSASANSTFRDSSCCVLKVWDFKTHSTHNAANFSLSSCNKLNTLSFRRYHVLPLEGYTSY